MRILAVDTATMITSIGVLEDDHIIADYSLNQEKTHSELLMPMIKDVMDGLGLELEDIDIFAVSKGPGSFTGLRIGMTALKTMAQVLDKKIIGISTLEALAYGVYSDKLLVPIIDARGKRFFIGGYKWIDGSFTKVFDDTLVTLDTLYKQVSELNEDIVFVGDAGLLVKESLKDLKNVYFTPASLNNCIGPNLCCLAKDKAALGDFDSYFDLAPNYIRKPQAELDFGKNRKSK